MQKPIASLMTVGLLLLAARGTEVAGSDSRVLQLTFDGNSCTYEGPRNSPPDQSSSSSSTRVRKRQRSTS